MVDSQLCNYDLVKNGGLKIFTRNIEKLIRKKIAVEILKLNSKNEH